MLVDSFIDADRLLLRVQIIGQSRPPLRWCDHSIMRDRSGLHRAALALIERLITETVVEAERGASGFSLRPLTLWRLIGCWEK